MAETSHTHSTPHTLPAKLWFVIPCYNESATLDITAPQFLAEMQALIQDGFADQSSHILFVNDGSSDDTWEKIVAFSEQNPIFCGLSLSRNKGHQNALMAGLMAASQYCDCAISLDSDGQDDVSVVRQMLQDYAEGSDVVYGVRSNRDTDSWFKRTSAEAFYKVLNSLGAEVVFNHADYRLLSARALHALSQYGESNLYLRGLIPLIGFPSSQVEYTRNERQAGQTHYPLAKMIALAIDGVTSLSTRPIRMVVNVGIGITLFSVVVAIWAIVMACTGNTVAGWATLMCAITLLGGVQLISVGVIGEYVGKTYLEVKRRPRYIEQERTWSD